MEEIGPEIKRSKALRYPESFKREVVNEHLRTGIPKAHLQLKYGIKFKSAIFHWMKEQGYLPTPGNNPNLGLINKLNLAKKSKNTSSSLSELENKIALLERQLEDERLRTELYKRMVEIAEREYKIPIRKNSNTK